jgi:peptidoglycan/LPS O-acetylase OafA/YrhL
VSLALALLSWHLVEVRFLRLKHRFEPTNRLALAPAIEAHAQAS